MIRFIDLRYQGTQSRFAFWDTVTDRFEEWSGTQAWCTWDEFERDATLPPVGPGIEDALARRRNLCPLWVYDTPTEEETEFPEGDNISDELLDAVGLWKVGGNRPDTERYLVTQILRFVYSR